IREEAEGRVRHMQNEVLALREELKQKTTHDGQQSNNVAYLTALLNHLSDGIIFSADGLNILFVNQRMCDMVGSKLTPKELVGQDISVFLNSASAKPVDTDGATRRVLSLVENARKPVTDRVPMSDGRVFRRRYTPVLVRGVAAGYLISYSDITQIEGPGRDSVLEVEFSREIVSTANSCVRGQKVSLTETFAKLGEISAITSICLFKVDMDNFHLTLIDDWATERSEIAIADLQEAPFGLFKWISGNLIARMPWFVANVNEMPADAALERELLSVSGFVATAGLPFYVTETNTHYFLNIGYDKEFRFTEAHKTQLTMLKDLCQAVLVSQFNTTQTRVR
ncbi:MAG TPA: PAS domain-containing protein, partial [Fimbriimonas sp.]|nr:PAS domain-containing protein [Fimbriimonas sp.]